VRSGTGLLRGFIRKYRPTKDLEVKIRETKQLGPIVGNCLFGLCWDNHETG